MPWPIRESPVIRQETLGNGLQVTFADQSNRYFGDYYRVCVTATIVCTLAELPAVTTEEAALRRRAEESFGTTLRIVRRLERMGVPSADVNQVRDTLIDDFLAHAAGYLARPGYPCLLVTAELRARGLSSCHA